MKIGKIPAEKLQEIVLDKIGYQRDEVLVHAGIGEDCSVIDLGDDLLVISSDPITGADKNAGYLAVHVACNDLAAMGATPLGIQVILLLPPQTSNQQIASLMKEIAQTAKSIDAEILGGHTEVLSYVSKAIIVITAVGKVDRQKLITSAGAVAGDDLLITKGVGIEGTFILAGEYKDRLLELGVTEDVLAKAKDYSKKLSVIREGLIAAESGAHAMHDVTEGGLYGALSEMISHSGKGFELYLDKLPILEETGIICRALNIDPAGLISSGSMLIAAADSQRLIERLEENKIAAFKIGKVISQGKYVIEKDCKKKFQWAEKDELWGLME